jgi:anionic cell wall polymer biosynthesis LytR-Cps2A-Psr (LCP) family protein
MIIVLVVIAIAVAALVSVGRSIFGADTGTDPSQRDAGQTALLDTSVGNSVRMTVRGPIVANENFRSYRVAVDASGRNITTFGGYGEQVIDTNQLSNTVKAYEEFVYALDKANMMKGEALSGDADDTRGICATGNVYEFEVVQGGMVSKRLWASTCKGSPGSFKGSVEQVEKLFLGQIPDNKEFLKKIDL